MVMQVVDSNEEETFGRQTALKNCRIEHLTMTEKNRQKFLEVSNQIVLHQVETYVAGLFRQRREIHLAFLAQEAGHQWHEQSLAFNTIGIPFLL